MKVVVSIELLGTWSKTPTAIDRLRTDCGVVSDARVNSHNGYRTCDWDTRVETIELVLERSETGRLLRRRNGEVDVVADGLVFGNGVALTHGGDAVWVAETAIARTPLPG